jgi:hypothetical protein
MAKEAILPPNLRYILQIPEGVVLWQLLNESERGAALAGAAWVEGSLLGNIRSALLDRGSTDESIVSAIDALLGEEAIAGSFFAKIRFAYCMRGIGPAARGDLQIIQAIRDEFVRRRSDLTFQEDSISQHCGLFQAIDFHNQAAPSCFPSPRDKYIAACTLVAGCLDACTAFNDVKYRSYVERMARTVDLAHVIEAVHGYGATVTDPPPGALKSRGSEESHGPTDGVVLSQARAIVKGSEDWRTWEELSSHEQDQILMLHEVKGQMALHGVFWKTWQDYWLSPDTGWSWREKKRS